MMESSVQMENSGFSGSQVCPPLKSCRPSETLRQIIVPVELTTAYPTSIDYAICFAKAFSSTLNLLYLYQEPYIVESSRRRGRDLFCEQRRKVFADFYKLLRETRNRYPDSIGYFEYGDPEREIDLIARQLRAGLIIVSGHNSNWLEHLLFGRHADWNLANALCPVLVIREGKTDLIGRTTSRALKQ
jgi:nucleotide-binding universal stress UspA family protein